jgi:hypothetical protein
MAKKIIIGLTGFVLLAAAAVYAAEKVKDKAEAAKPEQTKAGEVQKHKEGLIDQLLKAYKADDKKAMDEIITKLEKRQKQMKKFAQFEKMHQMAHRKMMMRGCGFQQGANRGGCPGMQMNRNWGPPAGGFKPIPQMRQPGGFAPMPQMKGCQQGPNEKVAPPAEKPGAMWNDNDQMPDSEEITAMNDQELFATPDNELALNDDALADLEW